MSDAVRNFDVELDISDRQALYDYDKGERVERPAGGWDAATRGQLSRRASVGHLEDDETFALRVGLMDRTWKHHKKILEKRAENEVEEDDEDVAQRAYAAEEDVPSHHEDEDDDDDDEGAPDPIKSETYIPRRVLPIFQPGEVVKGAVVLDLAAPFPAESLSINILGRTQIQVRVYHHRGFYDHRKSEDYVDKTRYLWKNADNVKGVTEAFSLLSSNAEVYSKAIPAGQNRFLFEFTLPADGQASVPPLIPSTANYAHVVYRLKAIIETGPLSKDIIRSRGIWVERPYDIASIPGHFKPISVEEVHKTGVLVKTGKVVLRVTLPRRAWVRGEMLPLKLQVDNQASTEIDIVKARILLHGKSRTSESRLAVTSSIKMYGGKRKDGPVPAGKSFFYSWQLPLDFSESSVDNNLVPVGPLDCFKLLDIHYDVVVKAIRKGFHRDVVLSIPITVGSFNSKANDE